MAWKKFLYFLNLTLTFINLKHYNIIYSVGHTRQVEGVYTSGKAAVVKVERDFTLNASKSQNICWC